MLDQLHRGQRAEQWALMARSAIVDRQDGDSIASTVRLDTTHDPGSVIRMNQQVVMEPVPAKPLRLRRKPLPKWTHLPVNALFYGMAHSR